MPVAAGGLSRRRNHLSLSGSKLLAHAYRPDDVRTLPATAVRKTSARLNGSVNPAGAPVQVHFEFGRTTAYGQRTTDEPIAPGQQPCRVLGRRAARTARS